MRRAVFLDRDGVLNRTAVRGGKPYAPRRAEDFRLLAGVSTAVRALKRAGYLVVVVTNQPDIGHGLMEPGVLERMHRKLKARVPVDDIRVCPHRQDAGCPCRKPRPGMLLDAACALKIDLAKSYMVGDRESDVIAGKAAGCYTLLIKRGYSASRFGTPQRCVHSLLGAARIILNRTDNQLGGRPCRD